MSEMNLAYAEGWQPEPGAVLVGNVTEVGTGWSDYMKGHYPIVTVQPEGKGNPAPVAVHCFHAALLSRMMDLRPKVGERIGIKYEGQRPHKSIPGQSVSVYIVKVDGRTDASDVWNRVAQPIGRDTPAVDTPADDDIPF